MNLLKTCTFILACEVITTLAVNKKINSHGHNWWAKKGIKRRGPSRDYSRQSDGNQDSMMMTPMSMMSEMDTELSDTRLANNRVPTINFYSSIPNAIGVMGTSLLWLREISAAIGTPLPLWIFGVPAIVLGVGLMFMPDLTHFNIPLFYPDGTGEGDPLASFPPNIKNISIINPSSLILPPKLIMKRSAK